MRRSPLVRRSTCGTTRTPRRTCVSSGTTRPRAAAASTSSPALNCCAKRAGSTSGADTATTRRWISKRPTRSSQRDRGAGFARRFHRWGRNSAKSAKSSCTRAYASCVGTHLWINSSSTAKSATNACPESSTNTTTAPSATRVIPKLTRHMQQGAAWTMMCAPSVRVSTTIYC